MSNGTNKKDVYKQVIRIIADLTGQEAKDMDPMVLLLSVVNMTDISYILQQLIQSETADQTVTNMADLINRNAGGVINQMTSIGEFASMLAGSNSMLTSFTDSSGGVGKSMPPPEEKK